MAKKSTAARQSNAARRPQTTAKASGVQLVRQPQDASAAGAGVGAAVKSPGVEPRAASFAVAEKPRVAPAPTRPRPLEAPVAKAPVAKAATAPKPEPAAQNRARPASAQAARVARARATQRARIANMITPEHYSYVLTDLRLIASLAILMFAVIVVLHFVLG